MHRKHYIAFVCWCLGLTLASFAELTNEYWQVTRPATEALNREDFVELQKIYEFALLNNPTNIAYLIGKGVALTGQSNYVAAVEIHQKAIELCLNKINSVKFPPFFGQVAKPRFW